MRTFRQLVCDQAFYDSGLLDAKFTVQLAILINEIQNLIAIEGVKFSGRRPALVQHAGWFLFCIPPVMNKTHVLFAKKHETVFREKCKKWPALPGWAISNYLDQMGQLLPAAALWAALFFAGYTY